MVAVAAFHVHESTLASVSSSKPAPPPWFYVSGNSLSLSQSEPWALSWTCVPHSPSAPRDLLSFLLFSPTLCCFPQACPWSSFVLTHPGSCLVFPRLPPSLSSFLILFNQLEGSSQSQTDPLPPLHRLLCDSPILSGQSLSSSAWS